MGAIANAYVDVGARTTGFRAALNGLKGQLGSILDEITGVGGSAEILSSLLAGGFGKAILLAGGLAAAAAGVALALDAVFSRDDDQKFADSVAGLTSGFRGLSEEIKNTDKKIAEIMSRDATGGNGGWFSLSSWKALGERIVGVETMSSQIARNMANAATASKLFADNLVRGAIGGQMQADQKMGATLFAGLRKTAGQSEEERINAAAMKNVLDAQGGTRVAEQVLSFLRKNPDLVEAGRAPKDQALEMAGALARGDLPTTRLLGDMFDIAGERAKILAEEFESATGAGAELAQIEKDRIARLKSFAQADLERQQKATDKAAKDMIELPDQIDKMGERLAEFQQDRADRLRNSFQFAGLSEARDRLFTAAQDDKKDELTASKMQGEIDRLINAFDKLNMKWGMVN